MNTLIQGIKAIHKISRTKTNADLINANARKVCLADHQLTRTGRAKMCEVPNIFRVFLDTLRSYSRIFQDFKNSFLYNRQTNPKRQYIFKETGNL